MWVLIVMGVIAAVSIAGVRWVHRRSEDVDYHERDFRDPPVGYYGS